MRCAPVPPLATPLPDEPLLGGPPPLETPLPDPAPLEWVGVGGGVEWVWVGVGVDAWVCVGVTAGVCVAVGTGLLAELEPVLEPERIVTGTA
jgi:hypothetical protein